ncbi:MAG: abortive infection protein [Proteobacteria bacterium]|nr:abortive infection protein [Pseudomonadota bacterium]
MFEFHRRLRRSDFLTLASLFQGALVVVAYVIGWLADLDPLADLSFDPASLLWGVAGTVPLYALFALSYRLPFEGMRTIRRFLLDKMGPLLDVCSTRDMVYLGLLAGVTEEILFRGVLQPLVESSWGWEWGLIGSNILFALAHWITPVYALLAGLTGLYLGLAMDLGGERNLLIPIVIHAVYDMLAFAKVAQTYREERGSLF